MSKKLLYSIIFFSISISCSNKDSTSTTGSATLKDIVALFPVEKLDQMIESLDAEERDQLLTKGESEHWKLRQETTNDQLTITNKQAEDNNVSFVIYPATNNTVVLAVQQVNAQVVAPQLWQYSPSEENPWTTYTMPTATFDQFISEEVTLPDSFKDTDPMPYIDVFFKNDGMIYSINDWRFLKEIADHYQVDDGLLAESYVKYEWNYDWKENQFTGKKVTLDDYKKIITVNASIIEDNGDGPGINEFDCPHGVTVSSSSQLPGENGSSYDAAMMMDGKDDTAWAVGNGGVGQSITFTIKENFLIGDSYQIKTGYTKSKNLWQANNRVKKLKVYVKGELVAHVILLDTDQYQSFSIHPNWMKNSDNLKIGEQVRFEIEEIYKSNKYNDTLISYFVPTGNCG